jgi:GT2 family glycosyltransferase
MANARVSVVVPTRNRAALLARAIAGVAAQTHPELELIVVDDASSPEQSALNAQVVLSLPGSRHLTLEGVGGADGAGSGPSCVRNAGIAAASGDFIAFCDDDDEWCDPDFLATAVAAFAADAGLDILFGNQEAVVNGAVDYVTWQPRLDALLAARGVPPGEVTRVTRAECLVAPGDFAHMNICVFRKTLLDAIGAFDPALHYCEDLDLFVRAADRARGIAHLRHTVARHHVPDRSRRDNASTRLDEQARNVTLDRVATRLMERCTTPEARGYGRRLGALACRRLALAAASAARRDEALDWARRAGAWQPTLRWTLYTQLLRWRRLGGRLAP